MSREALRESLSALLDDESSELEVRRLLAAGSEDDLRSTWSRYHVARAAMHKELLEPRLDLASAVSAALAAEPALKGRASPLWQGLGRFAVAASVTLVVLAGVRVYNQDELMGQQLAQQGPQSLLVSPQAQTQGPAILAGYNTGSGVESKASQQHIDWYAQRIPNYLRQHAQQAAYNASESALPLARAASQGDR